MTAAFVEFMRQYNMTGSEKADGYSRDAFVGLDDIEKDEAFKLLENELPFSAEWLHFINPQKAIAILRDNEKKYRGEPYRHVYMYQEALIKFTGDLSYQEQMFQDYPHYADYLRPHVVRSISRTPSNIARINFFKQVILVDANDEAVLEAADTLLNMLGVPSSSDGEIQHYQCLQDRLCSQSGQDKLDAFTKLEKYMYPDNS